MKATKDHLIIKAFESKQFCVKENGRVFRYLKCSKKWVPAEKQFHNRDYYYINFDDTKIQAHRLVWYFHHGWLDSNLCINHKDGNGLNNKIENLELLTWTENQRHARKILGFRPTGPKGDKCALTKYSKEKALEVRKLYNSGLKNYLAISRLVGMSDANVRSIILRQTWAHLK